MKNIDIDWMMLFMVALPLFVYCYRDKIITFAHDVSYAIEQGKQEAKAHETERQGS